MKFGMRTPNIKKSFKARTTGRIKRYGKKVSTPGYGKKGVGWIKDPKKSAYNKIYNKTTIGVSDILHSPRSTLAATPSPDGYAHMEGSASTIHAKNKWISLLLCIFTIFGHKFYEGKIIMGIIYLLTIGLFGIGWIIDIFLIAVKPNPYYVQVKHREINEERNLPFTNEVLQDLSPVQKTTPDESISTEKVQKDEGASEKTDIEVKTERHKIAGTSFRQSDIKSLGEENDAYTWTKKELAEYNMTDENIYQLEFSPVNVELVEEPTNEQDPNAVKVLVDGIHIGYIKKGSCSHIKKLLKEDRIIKITAEIYGGKYKRVSSDYDIMDDKETLYMEKGETDFFASIYLDIKS